METESGSPRLFPAPLFLSVVLALHVAVHGLIMNQSLFAALKCKWLIRLIKGVNIYIVLTSWTDILQEHTSPPSAANFLEVWIIELQMQTPRSLRLSLQMSRADRRGMQVSITANAWQESEHCTNHNAQYRTTLKVLLITIKGSSVHPCRAFFNYVVKWHKACRKVIKPLKKNYK